jgi:serine/threonine protein kinase
MADLRGQQLGNYHLQQLLGQGGFADVYLGEHIHLRTPAAIKVLQTRLGQMEMPAFLAEARTIATLEHPNIIRILDFGVQENTPFIVMYYAANGSLRQRHPKGSVLPLDLVVTYVQQIASALHYAHTQKLIHRDVKPENMLFGGRGEVLLSDFGIAQTAQSSQYQHTGTIVGTAGYMSPEQLQGKPSRASDQYSLGIVVYEWLTGTLPFQGNFMELYSQHLNVAPPSLCARRSELPPDVDIVLQKALAKDQRMRFNTIQEFAQALEQASTPIRRQPGNSTAWQIPQTPPVDFSPSMPVSAQFNQATASQMTNNTSRHFSATPSASASYSSASLGPHAAVFPPPPPIDPASNQASTWQTPARPYPAPQPQWGVPPTLKRPPNRALRTVGIFIGILVIIAIVMNIGAHFGPSGSDQQAGSSQNANSTAGSNTGSTTTNNTNASTPQATTPPSPTPTPAPAAGTVLYQANWSQGADDWNLPPQWKAVGNGTLGSDGSADGSANNSFIVWAPASVTGSNYAVEANIQFVRSTDTFLNGSYEFGIIVRGDGNSSGYEAGVQNMQPDYLSDLPQGAKTLIANIQGDNTGSTASGYRGFATTEGLLQHQAYQPDTQPHTLRAEVFGNTIKLFIDGTLVVSTTDNTYTAGRVGLRAVDADINVTSFKVIACSVNGC